VVDGNESYSVHGSDDQSSLSLPAGSSATSIAQCTGIDHPTMRFFARNTGAPSTRLRVEVLYPGLLGSIHSARLADIGASSDWGPSGIQTMLLTNVLATLSLQRTAVAFRFTPLDGAGQWSIDDVYVDPYRRG
jgi:hypothetical protein